MQNLRQSRLVSPLTEDDAEWLVLYAAQQWALQTGAMVRPVYLGRTTAIPQCEDGLPASGQYIVGVVDEYVPQGKSYGGDICIGGRNDWHISEYFNGDGQEHWQEGYQFDLVTTLEHEFGHRYGLGHTSDTTMNSFLYSALTVMRSLTGDDIARIREHHPAFPPYCATTMPRVQWASRCPTSGTACDVGDLNTFNIAQQSLQTFIHSSVSSALGASAQGESVVVAAPLLSATTTPNPPIGLYFMSATVPIRR